MRQVKLVTWEYSGSGVVTSYSMLQAVVLWDEKTKVGTAVWDLSHPGENISAGAYADFYSKGDDPYLSPARGHRLLPKL